MLIEDFLAKLDDKIEKEIEKAAKRFGDKFDQEMYHETNPRVVGYQKERDEIHGRFAKALNDENLEELRK